MEGYGAETYGERSAASYDDWQALTGVAATTAPTVAALADLAGAGPVLELGVGTGRIALPLRDLGHDVHGIDASPAMIEGLRAKPGGADVQATPSRQGRASGRQRPEAGLRFWPRDGQMLAVAAT